MILRMAPPHRILLPGISARVAAVFYKSYHTNITPNNILIFFCYSIIKLKSLFLVFLTMKFRPQQRLHNISLNKNYWPEKYSVSLLHLNDYFGNKLSVFESDYNKLKAYIIKNRIDFDKLHGDEEKIKIITAAQLKIIAYFSQENLHKYELDVLSSSFAMEGNIVSRSGITLRKEGWQNCVVWHDNKIYIHPKVRATPADLEAGETPQMGVIGVSHSSFSQGKDVAFAGSFLHDQTHGWILENTTGHYGSRAYQLIQFLEFLNKQGLDLTYLTVKTWVPIQPHLKPPSPQESDYDISYENAAVLLQRVHNSKECIEKSSLDSSKIRAYRAALKSHTLDSSDYILLLTAILQDKLGHDHPDLIEVKNLFFQYQYQEAIIKLHLVCARINLQITNPKLFKEVMDKAIGIGLKDQPFKNDSRRYFDTKIAIQMKKRLVSHDYNCMRKFSEFLDDYVPRKLGISVKCDVQNYSQLHKVFMDMRNIADNNTTILSGHDTFRAQSLLYKTKDRGNKRLEQTNIPSMVPGILRTLSPCPQDEYVDLQIDRIPDLFTIGTKPGGFSNSATHTPFVNSLSGSTSTLIYMLSLYIEKNNNDPDLQTDIFSIIKNYLICAVYQGYHSFYEMMPIFKDPLVIELFAKHHLVIDTSNIADEVLNEVFEYGIDYATTLGQKKTLLNAISKGITLLHRPKPEEPSPLSFCRPS